MKFKSLLAAAVVLAGTSVVSPVFAGSTPTSYTVTLTPELVQGLDALERAILKTTPAFSSKLKQILGFAPTMNSMQYDPNTDQMGVFTSWTPRVKDRFTWNEYPNLYSSQSVTSVAYGNNRNNITYYQSKDSNGLSALDAIISGGNRRANNPNLTRTYAYVLIVSCNLVDARKQASSQKLLTEFGRAIGSEWLNQIKQ